MTVPSLAQLSRISSMAQRAQRPYRTFLRQLIALHGQDRERGQPTWMFRGPSTAGGGHWLVNELELRRLHPELYERRFVTRKEHDEHDQRLADVEKQLREEKVRARALAARVFRIEKQMRLPEM